MTKDNILLINENSYALFVTQKVIEMLAPGIKVVTCKQIDELASFLHHYYVCGNYPDLILADFNHNTCFEGNYLDTLSSAVGRTRIIATGISEDDVAILKRYNISEYLAKPITVNNLAKTIRK